MEISTKDLLVLVALLSGVTVFALGFSLRVAIVALQHTGRERIELMLVAIFGALVFGGSFISLLANVLSRL